MKLFNYLKKYGLDIFIMAMLTILPVRVFTNELDQHQRELSEMQSLIEQQKKSAIEAEQHRQSAIQSRAQTQTQLSTAQSRAVELNAAQQNLQRSLEFSSSLLNQTEDKLSQLQGFINHTMLFLLFADLAETKLHQSENDTVLLSIYLQKLFDENNKLNVEMISISRERQNREKEFTEVQNRSIEERNRIEQISTNIARLDTDIMTFERQREVYQNRADELQRSAIALQELINTLQDNATRPQFTYAFPNGVELPLVGRIITNFGPRKNERYNVVTISNGINIATPENTFVKAFADGEVVFSDVFTGSGRMIIIDHKNGFHTVYGYNNDLLVQRGDMVSRGQAIARSGMTGSATEPSLHFELRRNGLPVNPVEFIDELRVMSAELGARN